MTPPAEGFLASLGAASLAAAGLILAVFLLRRAAPAATAKWRMALWTVLVLRMALAWVPLPSRTFEVMPPAPARPTLIVAPEALGPRAAAQAPPAAPAPAPARPFPWAPLLVAIWALGAAALLARLLQGYLALWRGVRRGRVLTHQPTLDLLERCKDDLGVRTVLGIVVTERVPSPALFGLVRPRLLLPPQVLETLPPEGLRHVFLHELVHLKRWDILMAWACSLLQAVHWFNPMVWLAFRRMRADRELACDEGAVRPLAPGERGAYGHTLLRLQELLAPPSPLPNLAGVVEEAGTFTRRIQMIAKFRQPAGLPRWSPATAGLLGLFALGAFSFTLAARGEAPAPPRLAHPIQDKVDYPFVDDPEVIGTWRLQALVPEPGAFVPGQATERDRRILAAWERELPFMMPFSVRPGGTTSGAQTWTRGLFLFDNGMEERTASRYEIRNLQGTDYLLAEFKNGDYTYRGKAPEWLAFRRESRQPAPASRREDKVDFPFVDDPAVHGAWHAVDFVRSPDDFNPARPESRPEDLWFKGLTFEPEGRTQAKDLTWTAGLVLDVRRRTASSYALRTLQGRTYLFMEWKSGDYTLRGMKPSYYVLAR